MSEEDGGNVGVWEPKVRVDEELEFFTELALHETERWIQAVTRKKFVYPDDPRKSLENGILLCEMLNCLKPGAVRKINRLPTPIAFLDNVHVFLEACSKSFQLNSSQLFDACDLEDLSNRAISDSEDQLKHEIDRRLRHVAITIFWLGKAARKFYDGPHLDLTAFSDLVKHQVAPHEIAPPATSHFRQGSSDSATESQTSDGGPVSLAPGEEEGEEDAQHVRQASANSLDHSSAYGSYKSDGKSSQSSGNIEEDDHTDPHIAGDNSYDSLIEGEPVTGGNSEEGDLQLLQEDIPPTANLASTMPVRYDDQRRHSSYVKSNEIRYSATLDSVYDGSDSDSSRRNAEHYRSSPSLNMDSSELRPYDRYRFGSQEAISIRSDSVDSLDTSSRKSDHSRQSSGSDTFSYTKNTSYRRASTTNTPKPPADPLQFVKHTENPLARTANKVVEVMDKQKKEKKTLQTTEDDWQTTMKEDTDWVSDLSAWKHKMRRKSANTYTRAIEADEISKKTEEDQTANRKNKTFKEMMEEKKERKKSYNIYPFGEEDDGTFKKPEKSASTSSSTDDKLDEFGFVRRETKVDPKEDKLSKWRGTSSSSSSSLSSVSAPTNDSKPAPTNDSKTDRYSLRGNDSDKKVRDWRSQVAKSNTDDQDSKLKQWKSQESLSTENKISKWKQREKVGEEEFKKEGSPAFKSEIPKQDRFSRWRHAEKNDDVTIPKKVPIVADEEHTASWARTTESERTIVASRESKAPSMGKRWEQQFGATSKPAAKPEPKPYKPFVERTTATTSLFSQRSEQKDNIEDRKSSVSTVTGRQDIGSVPPQASSRRRYGAVERPESFEDIPSPRSGSDVPRVRQDENKGTYVEKSVKVNAKPESTKGFGFTIKGGKESGTSISIEKVSIGSPADVCELLAGDEIVSINGAEVGRHYKESVMHVITQAVTSGVLDLRIRRYISTGGEDEFMDESDDSPPPRAAPRRFELEEPEEEPKEAETSIKEESLSSAPMHQVSSEAQQGAAGEESEESFCSDDEALERQIMEQLEAEAVAEAEAERLHEMTLQEDNFARQESLHEEGTDEDEPDDAPPPIPSEPPPAPNWSTFPSASTEDEELGDVLPVSNRTLEEKPAPRASDDRRKSAMESLESTMRIRVDALRRRSEYLGTNFEDMEEYKKIQAEMERESQRIAEREEQERRSVPQAQPRMSIPDPREDQMWSQIEKRSSKLHTSSSTTPISSFSSEATPITTSSFKRSSQDEPKPTDLLWQRIEGPHKKSESSNESRKGQSGVHSYRPEYDLEQAEREIIENLEREENARTHKKVIPPWRDAETSRPKGGYSMEEVEARVAKDMEITMESRVEKPIKSSMRFFDFEEDQRRMEEWNKENERRIKPNEQTNYKVETQITLQEQFERDQDDMRRRYEEEKRQADAILEEKRKKEELLMEKERAHQRELEALRIKQDAERERRAREEEERRQRLAAEAEERRKKQEVEFLRLQEITAEEERLRHEEAELQKRLTRQKIHVEREKSASPTRPHGEYTFTFAVNNQASPNIAKAPWKRDTSEERQQRAREAEEARAREEAEKKEADMREQAERTAKLQRDREEQMAARMRQGASELSSHHDHLFGGGENQAWTDNRTNPGYPYKPTEAPVSQLNDYTSPLQIDVGRQTYQQSREHHYNNEEEEYSRSQMQPGYGYQELSRPLTGIRDPASAAQDEGPRPQFNVEIGSTDTSRRVTVDRDSVSPPKEHYDQFHKYGSPSNTPEIVARRDVMEKHPSRGYSPDRGYSPERAPQRSRYSPEPARGYSPEPSRYGLPQTSRSKDEITVKRSTIDWNKAPQRKEESPVHREPPTARYAQSLDAGRQNPRLVKLNQRTAVPRPDDYWMRDSNGPTSPQYRAGGSREEQMQQPRKSWLEDSQDSAYRSRTDSGSSNSRKSLHSLSATPKQRIISGNDWIVSEEDRKRQEKQKNMSRHGEIMRQQIPNTSDHWLVEEAERRRRADRSGQGRASLQSRPNQLDTGVQPGYWTGDDNQYRSPTHYEPAESQYGQTSYYKTSTHVMEHTAAPDQDQSRPSRPIPDAIKQTLIQRVTNPKSNNNSQSPSSQGPSSPSYQYQQYNAQYSSSSSTSYSSPHSTTPTQYSAGSVPYHPDDHYNQNIPPQPAPSYHLSYYEGGCPPPPAEAPSKPPRAYSGHGGGGSGGSSSEATHAEVVSVSGHQKCAHCEEPLGHGAAMIIESLNLYYHVQCFRCCVCHAALGTGKNGADVRVRVSKLHCQNCYSNDEVGLKYSRV